MFKFSWTGNGLWFMPRHVMVLGHEEKDSNAVTFLERNFATENPDLWITQDTTTRVMENDRVMENHEGSFKPLPDFDLYGAGFPCTPWSRHACLWLRIMSVMSLKNARVMLCLAHRMAGPIVIQSLFPKSCSLWLIRRGQRAGFDDENAKPFFVATLTIKLKKFRVFMMEKDLPSFGDLLTEVSSVAHGHTSESADNGNDLDAMFQNMEKHPGEEFLFTILKDRCPAHFNFSSYAPGRDMNSRVLPVMIHSYVEPCHVTSRYCLFMSRTDMPT